MKKLGKYIGTLVLVFMGLFALASCGSNNLTMAEKFNKAGLALSSDNSFTEIEVGDISSTISNQKANEVIVIVYSNISSTNGSNVVYLDQLHSQYNEYGKQKYSTDIEFSLYFVDNTDLSDEDKATFFTDSKVTNSGIVDDTYALLVYVDKTLDINSTLSKWDDVNSDVLNSEIFTFEVGDKLEALVG